MGSTDNANHLRATATVRRSHQPKWTKKFIEYIVDCCYTNAYLIWKRNPSNQRRDHRERGFFLQELINGLLQVQEKAHIPVQLQKRTYCGWKDCQTAVYNRRKPLQEVRNITTRSRSSRTYDHCDDCMKSLCIGKGCWAAYHKDNGLQIRPEDDVVGRGST